MRQPGFTLIQLLLTISLIAILSVIFVIQGRAIQSHIRDTERRVEIQLILNALEQYRNDQGVWLHPKVSPYSWENPETGQVYIHNYCNANVQGQTETVYCSQFLICQFRKVDGSPAWPNWLKDNDFEKYFPSNTIPIDPGSEKCWPFPGVSNYYAYQSALNRTTGEQDIKLIYMLENAADEELGERFFNSSQGCYSWNNKKACYQITGSNGYLTNL